MSYTALKSRKKHDKPSCIKIVRDHCVEEYQAVDYFFHNMRRYFELHLRFMLNKTVSRQCIRAVWSTFADIHSTHPRCIDVIRG